MPHAEEIARLDPQQPPSLLRERRLVQGENIAVHLVEGGVDLLISGGQYDLRPR